jgi:hypothetical protein
LASNQKPALATYSPSSAISAAGSKSGALWRVNGRSGITVSFLSFCAMQANPVAAYRLRSAQLISAFGIGPSVRISHRTGEQCRRDIRGVGESRSSRCRALAADELIQVLLDDP